MTALAVPIAILDRRFGGLGLTGLHEGQSNMLASFFLDEPSCSLTEQVANSDPTALRDPSQLSNDPRLYTNREHLPNLP